MGDDKKKEKDLRIEYIYSRVMCAFGIPKGKLDKVKAAVAASETSGRALESFLGDAEVPYLFFFPGGEGFEASKEFPSAVQLKKKSLVVHRSAAHAEITKTNYQDTMLFMNLARTPSGTSIS
jgi:hypothetical protein